MQATDSSTRRRHPLSLPVGRHKHKPRLRRPRRTVHWRIDQGFETLEAIALLSTTLPTATSSQTITLGDPSAPNLPTNYTNQPFAPALQLFDPGLGTLQSVQVTSHVVYDSNIAVANLSQAAPATAMLLS
jgi:hypothetical protein